ncbi:MAG: hypothetical protein WHT82_06150 [Limisphaera sp.]
MTTAAEAAEPAAGATRPNILWITCEDIGPHLGCYGILTPRRRISIGWPGAV